jgi:hypothetical protein
MHNIVDLESWRKSSLPTRASTHTTVVLNDAAARVRQIESQIQTAEGEACGLAMDVGDVLTPIRKTIRHGRWLPFLRDCGLSSRTAQVYLQLAAARSVIEAANAQSSAHLSIADALKLIRPKKSQSEQAGADAVEPESDPACATTIADVLAWLPKATPDEKRRVAVWLAQDTATMRKILPARALPLKPTPTQIFDRAMRVLSTPEDVSPTAK